MGANSQIAARGLFWDNRISRREIFRQPLVTVPAPYKDWRFEYGDTTTDFVLTRTSSKTRFNHFGQMELVSGSTAAYMFDPEKMATSNTSFSCAVGTVELSISPAWVFRKGDVIRCTRTSDATKYLYGYVRNVLFNGKIIVTFERANGVGTFSDWTLIKSLGVSVETSRTNQLFNATIDGANLATQTRTLTNGVQYILSFYGTGSVTLSGGASLTLNGVGAFPARAWALFTTTSKSVTFTVSGQVQFAQCEQATGAYVVPSSFIPTAGASALRNADVLSSTGATFTGWFNSAGTLALKFSTKQPNGYRSAGLGQDASNGLALGLGSGASTGYSVSVVANTYTRISPASPIIPGEDQEDCVTVAPPYIGAHRGCGSTSGNSVSTVFSYAGLYLGSLYGGAAITYTNGYIARARFWNSRLTDAQIHAAINSTF